MTLTLPDWVQPWTGEPSTGWLSPEGVLYACAPWHHSDLARDLLWAAPQPPEYVALYDRLHRMGWALIGRTSYSVFTATGGVFAVRRTQPLTDAQVAFLNAWMDAGTRVEDCPT